MRTRALYVTLAIWLAWSVAAAGMMYYAIAHPQSNVGFIVPLIITVGTMICYPLCGYIASRLRRPRRC